LGALHNGPCQRVSQHQGVFVAFAAGQRMHAPSGILKGASDEHRLEIVDEIVARLPRDAITQIPHGTQRRRLAGLVGAIDHVQVGGPREVQFDVSEWPNGLQVELAELHA
jgi:hypothetical protein